jgi:hypothetical protein
MAEPIKPPRIVLDPQTEATILDQERQLEVIKRMRTDAASLGEPTGELDKYIELAESIIASSKAAIAKIKSL